MREDWGVNDSPEPRDPPAPEPLFSYRPEPSFTRTFGWIVCLVPLVGLASGVIDILNDRATSGLLTVAISLVAIAVLWLISRSIDRAQTRIRLDVLGNGSLRFRNVAGRVRSIDLKDHEAFVVRELRGRPRRFTRTDDGEVSVQHSTVSEASPHFVEIRVLDRRGKRHKLTLSGGIPKRELARLYDAVDMAREL
jgi:hypothetical protein